MCRTTDAIVLGVDIQCRSWRISVLHMWVYLKTYKHTYTQYMYIFIHIRMYINWIYIDIYIYIYIYIDIYMCVFMSYGLSSDLCVGISWYWLHGVQYDGMMRSVPYGWLMWYLQPVSGQLEWNIREKMLLYGSHLTSSPLPPPTATYTQTIHALRISE